MSGRTGSRRRHPPAPRSVAPPLAGGRARPLAAFLAAVFALKLAVMLPLKDHVLTQPDAGLDTSAYVALAGARPRRRHRTRPRVVLRVAAVRLLPRRYLFRVASCSVVVFA